MERIKISSGGESHGPAQVVILEGIPAGLEIELEHINATLARRQKGAGSGKRMQIEKDRVKILSGVMDSKTTGAPIAMMIDNLDHKNWVGKMVEPMTIPRPGHADLTAAAKYRYNDLRIALERASARGTVVRVAAGAICTQLLKSFGIQVMGYVISIGDITSQYYDMLSKERYERAQISPVKCPDELASAKMVEKIQNAIDDGETLGGIIEVVAEGVPIGLGSHTQWHRRLDARLGYAVLGIQAIKGVEIGPAFENTKKCGTDVHDAILLDNGRIYRGSNNAGGIEGGISNGEPIIVRAAMKPIASTIKPQKSINLFNGEKTMTNYERSDYCPVPRAVPVLETAVSIILTDALIEKLGGDSIEEMKQRYDSLVKLNISDFQMDGNEHIFWEEIPK